MAQRHRSGAFSFAVGAIVTGVLLSLGWGLLASVSLQLRPLLAIAWIAATLTAFLLSFRWGSSGAQRRRAVILGLRGLAPAVPWFILAVLFFLSTVLSLDVAERQLSGESGPVTLSYSFAELPVGWLILPLLVVATSPLIEEVFIRGFVQGHLARRLGAPVGVCAAAAVFALLHGSRAWLPYYFVLGLAFGYARVATRSLWAAVTMHAATNAMLYGLAALAVTPESFGWWSGPVLWSALIGSASLTLIAIHRSGVSVRATRGQRKRPAALAVVPTWRAMAIGQDAGGAHTRN